MAINSLLFDLDNTLINTHRLMRQWAMSFDQGSDDLSIQTLYKQYFPENTYQNKDDLNNHNAFVKELQKHTHEESLKSAFQDYLLANISPDLRLNKILGMLKERYKMAVVTNGSVKVQRQKLLKAELMPYFETVIISGELGVRKPHHKIFDAALNKLNCEPDCALFIGDSLENDITGANKLKMKTCWVNKHNIPDDLQAMPTYQVRFIHDISKVLL